MPDAWVLALDPPSSDPLRVVGGLPLALRLVLDAQAAGAIGVVVSEPALRASVAALIRERNASGRGTPVTIALFDQPPEGAARLSAPANWLVPRELMKTLGPSGDVDLARETPEPKSPYGFRPTAVVDRRTAKSAERALFRSLRKVQDGWTSRHLNRYLSLPISAVSRANTALAEPGFGRRASDRARGRVAGRARRICLERGGCLVVSGAERARRLRWRAQPRDVPRLTTRRVARHDRRRSHELCLLRCHGLGAVREERGARLARDRRARRGCRNPC